MTNVNREQAGALINLLSNHEVQPFTLQNGAGGIRYLRLHDEDVWYYIDLDGEVQGGIPSPNDTPEDIIRERIGEGRDPLEGSDL